MFDKFDYFNRGYIFGVKTDKYNPYINYTWSMLPNGQVQNNGTSGTNLQLYSGNPLDFQGSQSISIGSVIPYSFYQSPFSLVFNNIITFTNNIAFFWGGIADFEIRPLTSSVIRINCYNGVSNTLEIPYINGEYHNLVIVYNGTDLISYMNGEEVARRNYVVPNYVGQSAQLGGRSSSGADLQMDSFIAYSGILSPTQIQQSNSNPNAFYDSMVNDANTLFATDFRGTAGYIADDKNKVVGSDLIATTSPSTSFGVTFTTSGNETNFTINTLEHNARIILTVPVSGYYSVGASYGVVTNTDTGFGLWNGTTYVISYASNKIETNKTINNIVYLDSSITYAIYYLRDITRADATGTINVKDVFVKEISAVYPITNYSETMRTNFQQETTGLQDLTRSFDSLGFYTGVTDYLNCNGVGYGDTGWITNPSDNQDFSLELIAFAPLLEDRITQTTICGKLFSGSGNAFNIKTNTDSRCFINFGSSTTTIYPTVGQYFHLTVVKSAEPNSYSVFLNGVIDTESPKDSSIWSSDYPTSVLLGGAWTSKTTTDISYKDGIKLFKVHNKVLTQEEITTNYNNYVEQGLLQ